MTEWKERGRKIRGEERKDGKIIKGKGGIIEREEERKERVRGQE